MALTSLSNVKTGLDISDTSFDTALAFYIRRASSRIRTYTKRRLGAVISSISVAASAVVTCYGHGLKTNDVVVIDGSDCTPTIDGQRTITVTSPDTFTVPVTTTVAGTTGFIQQRFTEYYSGDGTRMLQLKQRPVQSVSSIYVDSSGYYGQGTDAFASSTLLTAGQDYALALSNATESESGVVYRLGDVWSGVNAAPVDQLRYQGETGLGNIKVTYFAGYAPIPYDLQAACEMMIARFWTTLSKGGALQSESLDYYSYTRLSPELEQKALDGVASMLAPYRQLVLG